MDVPEPPRIVFDGAATCADGRHSDAELKQALSRARAPAPAWLVTVRIHKVAASGLRADGDITDERGAAVGHREFTGKANDCDGLARAVGVWASLVLDAEVRKPRAAAAESQPADEAKRGPTSDAGAVQETAPRPLERDRLPEPLPADETPSKRDEPATLEVGVCGFVMSGIGGGSALVGATPFLLIAIEKGFFFRPAVAIGESLPASGPSTTWAALRMDGCWRVVGRYPSRRGLQMDMCGGVDGGVLDVSGLQLAYVAPGPSIDLGGELASDFTLVLRGLAGVNAIHDSRLVTPLFAGRGELGLVWRLR